MIHDRHLAARSALLLPGLGAPLETKEAPEPIALLTKNFGDHMEAVMKRLGASDGEIKSVGLRLNEIEQKMARRGAAPGSDRPASWGEQVANADQIKALGQEFSRPGRARVEMKATLTGAVSAAPGSSGALNPAQRDDTVVLAQRRMTIRSLLPVIQVTQGTVEYPRQTGRNLNASNVAEAALKPESDITFELKSVVMRTIAHWTRASRQILSDAPQLAGIIDSELLYGLALREEAQLLLGDGTGQNLTGMMPVATQFLAPVTIANANMIDIIGLALLQSALAEYPADGIIMHPADWLKIRLLKDAGNNYLLWSNGGTGAAPQGIVPQNLFGVPVVTTQAMPQNNYLVGNFQQAATLYDRWEARVETSTEDGDNFRLNLVTLLAEERIGLAVKQTTALTKGTFS